MNRGHAAALLGALALGGVAAAVAGREEPARVARDETRPSEAPAGLCYTARTAAALRAGEARVGDLDVALVPCGDAVAGGDAGCFIGEVRTASGRNLMGANATKCPNPPCTCVGRCAPCFFTELAGQETWPRVLCATVPEARGCP